MRGKKKNKVRKIREDLTDVVTIMKVEFRCTEIKEKGIPDKGGKHSMCMKGTKGYDMLRKEQEVQGAWQKEMLELKWDI